MDFETRQKSAVEEINKILAKYGLGLSAMLDGYPAAIVPKIKFIDNNVKKESEQTTQTNVKEKKSRKKGK